MKFNAETQRTLRYAEKKGEGLENSLFFCVICASAVQHLKVPTKILEGKNMKLKSLIGSGDKIGLLTLPFLIIGVGLNIMFPSIFSVGGPSNVLKVISIIILIPGIALWLWSVVVILTKVPRKELITGGPYALVKHPLYTGVALLVLPWIGFLLNSWLGILIGIILYIGSRIFSPAEEELLSKTFGAAWEEYCHKVKIPWL